MELGAVIGSGSGATCVSKKAADRMSTLFEGVQVAFEGTTRGRVADGRELLLLPQRTGRVRVKAKASSWGRP